ncbi:MAG: cobalamin synthesis protein P47K [Armatimonadetes bacterium]|nr:cobalamin synthesis protein P47K [Armatimonadota bacterium]
MREPGREVVFALVGGFLGAGKTTALLALARRLAEGGEQVAVITNDRAPDLVDTRYARLNGVPVAEIAGGCICARLGDLIDRCEELLDAVRPSVILNEPVGSAADLAATVLQPLQRYYGRWFRTAAYSVLVDPERFAALLEGPGQGSPLAYLFEKQLAEADLIVLNKVDRVSAEQRTGLERWLAEHLPATPVTAMSALTGEGLGAWWERVRGGTAAGTHAVTADRALATAAEASLAWCNASVELRCEAGFDGEAWARDLLAALRHGVIRANGEIGHLKLLLEGGGGSLRANLTGLSAPVDVQAAGGTGFRRAHLTLNARVLMAAAELEDLISRALQRGCNEHRVTPRVVRLRSLTPDRPAPTAG